MSLHRTFRKTGFLIGGVLFLLLSSLRLGAAAPYVTIIDLMVLYTSEARMAAGGGTAIQSYIDGAFAEANLVFDNSRASVRVRLVHTEEINYAESGSVSNDLWRLRVLNDGFLDDVDALRNQYAADLVCLITETGDDFWFYGLQGPSAANAFSIVRRNYLTGSYFFPVALSFNFGCQLERPYADSVGAFPYSYGYTFNTSDGGVFSTVDGLSGYRLPWFSNPDIVFRGEPTGAHAGNPKAANNTRTVNHTAPIVATFRGAAPTTSVPAVRVTNPVGTRENPLQLLEETNLTILVEASDMDGSVHQVNFFHDEGGWNHPRLLGTVTNSPFTFVWTNVSPGTHFLFASAVDDLGASARSTNDLVCLVNPVPPRNDHFTNATLLIGPDVSVIGRTTTATLEEGELDWGGATVWYSWTAPADGRARLWIPDWSNGTAFGVATGNSVSNLTFFAQNGGWSTAIEFEVFEGTNYHIFVAAWEVSRFTLKLHLTKSAPNDDFTNRAVLNGAGGTVTVTNFAASAEPGEPSHLAGNVFGVTPSNRSVWWTWTAPADGQVKLEPVCSFWFLLGVYGGDTVSNLTAISKLLHSGTTLDVTSGTTLQMAVDGANGQAGIVQFKLSFTAKPINDDFDDRIAIGGIDQQLSGSNIGATSEEGEPCVPDGCGRSVWWSWTAPLSGLATVRILTNSFFPMLAVYTGQSVSNLAFVASGGQQLDFEAVEGNTYQIAVNGFHAHQANFVLEVAVSTLQITTPANGANTLSGTDVLISASSGPTDGIIDRVDFYEGPTFLGSGTNDPFSIIWTNVSPGAYSLQAITTNTSGNIRKSKPVSVIVRPMNDSFDNRISLMGTNATGQSSSVASSLEPGEPDHAEYSYGKSVWWSWTAPAAGAISISQHGGFLDRNALAVYTGTSVSNLTLITNAWWFGRAGVIFDVTPGTTYQIASGGEFNGGLTLNLVWTPPPFNDDFANRVQILGDSAVFNGSTFSATKEPGEPNHRDDAGGRSLWWTWTATGFGRVSLTPHSVIVAVYTGDSVSNLMSVAVGGSTVTFDTVPGRTYQIALDSLSGQRPDCTLNFVFQSRPANDYFTNRTELLGSAAWATNSNVLGTQEPGEPSHGFTSGRSLWWSWTAPGSGLVSLDTTESGITAVLAVYTGTNLSQLALVTNGIVTISFSSVAGTTYQIAVDQWGGIGGGDEVRLSLVLSTVRIVAPTNCMVVHGPTNVALSIESTVLDGQLIGVDVFDNDVLVVSNAPPLMSIILTNAPVASHTVRVRATCSDNVSRWSPPITFIVIPSNDDFASRVMLSGGRVTADGITIGATKEAGEPNHDGYPASQSVWYSWTAPESALYSIFVRTAYYRPRLAVYEGDDLGDLRSVASNGFGTLQFQTVAGTTYHIAVDNRDGSYGTAFALEILRPPANDLFADRLALSGETVVVATSNLGAWHEPGEPAEGRDFSLWWSWTAPKTGRLTATGSPGGPFSLLAFYTGNEVSNLTQVIAVGGTQSFAVNGGTVYHIAASGRWTPDWEIYFTLAYLTPNDDFADRIPITNGPVTLRATNTTATSESNESLPGGASGRNLWWTWTAPTNGTVTLDISGSPFTNSIFGALYLGPLLAVYTGDSLTNLSLVASNTYYAGGNQPGGIDRWRITPTSTFETAAGTSYAISVDGVNGSSGEIVLQFAFTPAPPPPQPPFNDHFVNRFPLLGELVSTNGSNQLATREADEPEHVGQPGHASVWWSWTAPESGYVRLALTGNAFAPLLAVYTGNHLSNLVEVASGESSLLRFSATSGEVYQIVVDANSGSSGFTLGLELGSPPLNDAFTNRFLVSGFLTNLTGNNAFATSEQDEPLPGGATEQTLWWTWTAPSNGILTVLSQNFGAGAAAESSGRLRPPPRPPLPGRSSGPLLGIYAGNAITNLTLLASNSFYFVDPFGRWVGWRVREQFNFPMEAGVTYEISIDGCNGSSGTFQVGFEFTEAPPNDDFANAFLLSGEFVSVVGSNFAATKESGEPNRQGHPAASSLWWNWTAPIDGRLRINTDGSSFNPLIGVYRGDSLTNLIEVKTGQGSVEFFVIPGTVYKIALDGEPGITGDFALNLVLEPHPQNDNFANRIRLNGASVVATGSNVAATSEPGEPIHQESMGRSVWWSWTAPASGTVRVEASADFIDLALGVYVGTSVSTLLAIVDGINDVSFYAVAGITYEIAVADANGLEGLIHLRLNGPPPPPLLDLSQTVKLPGGAFKGSVNAARGQSFVIQASTDLVHWVNVIVDTSIDGSLTFTDNDASMFPHRFYRAVPLDALLDPQGLALANPPGRTSEGRAQLRLIGSAGRPFVLQASIDLVNWANLTSGLLGGDGFEFFDLERPSFDRRFYRALSLGLQR